MHNVAIRAFLERVYNQEELEGLYLRLRVGATQRKANLIHSNIDLHRDTETMVEEIYGLFEGWVYEEGDRCFVELMRQRKSNPIDVVAVLPSDIVEIQDDDLEEEVYEETVVKTLTDAVVKLAEDCNHRATISQDRYLRALEVMVESQIEMAHAQAALSVSAGADDPAWVKALSAISPAFGPLVGDVAKKLEANRAKGEEKEAESEAVEAEDPEKEKPPLESSPRVENPLEIRT